MDGIKQVIDFFFNIVLNVWNVLYEHGGIYFKITLVVVFVFPIFRRIVSYLISHGVLVSRRSGSKERSHNKKNKENN